MSRNENRPSPQSLPALGQTRGKTTLCPARCDLTGRGKSSAYSSRMVLVRMTIHAIPAGEAAPTTVPDDGGTGMGSLQSLGSA